MFIYQITLKCRLSFKGENWNNKIKEKDTSNVKGLQFRTQVIVTLYQLNLEVILDSLFSLSLIWLDHQLICSTVPLASCFAG